MFPFSSFPLLLDCFLCGSSTSSSQGKSEGEGLRLGRKRVGLGCIVQGAAPWGWIARKVVTRDKAMREASQEGVHWGWVVWVIVMLVSLIVARSQESIRDQRSQGEELRGKRRGEGRRKGE